MNGIFIAYPARPDIIGETIEAAKASGNRQFFGDRIKTWRRPDLGGVPVADPIIEAITAADIVVGDITVPNFNVTYELGYAFGLGKRVLPIRHRAVQYDAATIQKIGIYDTLIYQEYENADQLVAMFRDANAGSRMAVDYPADPQPIYMVLPPARTEDAVYFLDRVRKSGLRPRTFDPGEDVRLAAQVAVRSVAASLGVAATLLNPSEMQDADVHNVRVAFVMGIAHALQKVTLLVQRGDWGTPLDVRDVVVPCSRNDQLNTPVQEFVDRVINEKYATRMDRAGEGTLLAQLILGDPAAENEAIQLPAYFLERDEYRQVVAGRANIAVGRKGSGKTAVFAEVRERLKETRSDVVVDLSPETYQLRKFKDVVLQCLAEGSKEHLLVAFWEYVILLEVCGKLLDKDREVHKRNHNLFEPYQRLLALYRADPATQGIGFSERLLRLIGKIADRYSAQYGKSNVTLAESQVTTLLYEDNIAKLREEIEAYCQTKTGIHVLFDNLDKGWNANGLEEADIVIIRTLLDATRKLKNDFAKLDVAFECVVFLRNDVFEILVSATSDRGKSTPVLLDWVQPDLLKQMVRRRLIYNERMPKTAGIDELWNIVCVPTVGGVNSLDYMIQRSLMRPRFLLRLINHCKGHAINFGRQRIEEDDIAEGLSIYSTDVITEINNEIRDVLPDAKDILYRLLGEPSEMRQSRILELLGEALPDRPAVGRTYTMLLFHGVLGFRRPTGDLAFIHDVNYDLKRLLTLMSKTGGSDPLMQVNPAFWPGLELT